MKYPEHSDFCEYLLAIGCLDERHVPCLSSDRCVAEESDDLPE